MSDISIRAIKNHARLVYFAEAKTGTLFFDRSFESRDISSVFMEGMAPCGIPSLSLE